MWGFDDARLAPVDAATPPSEGGASEGGAPEGGAPPDERWCAVNAPKAFFCQDFDVDLDLSSGWTNVTTTRGGEVMGALTTDPFVSPPRAVRFGVVDGANPQSRSAVAELNAGRVTTSMRLSFDVHLEQLPDTATLLEIHISQGAGPLTNRLRTEVQPNAGNGATVMTYDETDAGTPWQPLIFPMNTWRRVSVTLTLLTLGPGAHLTVQVGEPGTLANLSTVVDNSLPSSWQPGELRFVVGMIHPRAGGSTMLLDNVVLELPAP